MDAAKANLKIYKGRAKAALRLGYLFDVHRPLTAASQTNKVATINAAFNSGDKTYSSPNLPGDDIWYGDFDGTQTQVGDYLINANDAYFIAAQQSLLPIVCVACNHPVKVIRQTQNTAVGTIDYQGLTPASETVILGSTIKWNASILFGGQRRNNATGLPMDVKFSGWRIMLPVSVPVLILAGDIIEDEQGKRYLVEGVELTDFGYRINASEEHT